MIWKFLSDLLRTPDAQRDPYAWSATLLAHAFIGVALAAVFPWWLPVTAYTAWEVIQWRVYGARAWDCLLDWSAVSLGVWVAVALWEGQGALAGILALVVVLAVGVKKRRPPI